MERGIALRVVFSPAYPAPMKSEHRHELQTNELGRYADQTVAFFQEHGNKVMMWVCAASLVLAAGIYWRRSSNVTESSAWSQYSTARNADEYSDVWKNYKNSPICGWRTGFRWRSPTWKRPRRN
jgi:hypothetical protein